MAGTAAEAAPEVVAQLTLYQTIIGGILATVIPALVVAYFKWSMGRIIGRLDKDLSELKSKIDGQGEGDKAEREKLLARINERLDKDKEELKSMITKLDETHGGGIQENRNKIEEQGRAFAETKTTLAEIKQMLLNSASQQEARRQEEQREREIRRKEEREDRRLLEERFRQLDARLTSATVSGPVSTPSMA